MSIKTVEEHLRELGPIETKRQIPGLTRSEHREVRYVEERSDQPFKELFEKLIWQVTPPLMSDGGALVERCVLTLPTGRRFQAISYRGDIDGWRRQIAGGAAAMKIELGELIDGVLVLDDGTSFPLSDCEVRFL